jgi:hypothetical protein
VDGRKKRNKGRKIGEKTREKQRKNGSSVQYMCLFN